MMTVRSGTGRLRALVVAAVAGTLVACGDGATAPGASGPGADPTGAPDTAGADGVANGNEIANGTGTQGLTLEDLGLDPRLTEIQFDCADLGPYLRDTADPIPILIGKLEHGDAEVLARATEELGAMGERAVPALERLLAEQFRDPQRVLPMQNTVRALALNKTDAATELLLLVLTHPEAALRHQALKVLEKRDIGPQHYDQLIDAALFEGGFAQTSALIALHASDPVAAAHQIVDWLLEQRRVLDDRAVGRLLVTTDDADLLVRFRDLHGAIEPRFSIYTDVALYAVGDEAATARTLERLVSPDPGERARILSAAQAAGSVELLDAIAREEPDPSLRTQAVQHLIGVLDGDLGEAAADTLVTALDDPDRSVRWAALDALVRRRHPVAVDRALALLDGGRQELETVLPALHQAMLVDPELAARGRAMIASRLQADESVASASQLALVQALALCPGEESARAVLSIADNAPDDLVLEKIRAYRYLAIQLANTGVDGRRVVYERLETQTEPLRRIDLLWAIGAHRDDLARELLADHVDRDDVDPWERVYAAVLLAKVGPTEIVAPILKAASRRFEQPQRRALDCLLHRWY